MKYINKNTLDIKIRLDYELQHSKNAHAIYMTLTNDEIEKLAYELAKQNKLPILDNIPSIAIRRYLERYRRKFKKSFKHFFIATAYNSNKILIHGLIFTENTEYLKNAWHYGKINIDNVYTRQGYIKKLFYKYVDENHTLKKVFTSKNFGKEVYKLHSPNNTKIPRLLNEVYKPIPNHKGYLISNYGNIISQKRKDEIILKQPINKYGNPYVQFIVNGKPKKHIISILVAKTFLNFAYIKNASFVTHKDGNKLNNHIDNLSIKLHKTSVKHA